MRLRRIEFIAVALTLAFMCFMGGYFVGMRGSVNIVAVDSQQGETLRVSTGVGEVHSPVSTDAQSATESGNDSPDATQETVPAVIFPTDNVPPGVPRGGDGRININQASRSELTDLPGIGEVLAGRIIDYRTQYGAFSRIEDIRNVSGIGEKRFEAIQDKITVGS